MQKRQLGDSGLQVPVICLGTMTYSTRNTQEEAFEQMDYALERDVNFIDTAEIYPFPQDPGDQGGSEVVIGNWLKERGNRKDVILASKVAIGQNISSRDVGRPPTYTKKKIREAIEGSLKRLQTDFLDLYQVHWPERNTNYFGQRGYDHDPKDSSTDILETLAALDELVEEGLVKNVGVSNETPWGLQRYMRGADKGQVKIRSIQNQYSLLNRTFELGLAEMSIKENIGLLAYSALNMGVLTGKYLDGARPKGARFSKTADSSGHYNPKNAQAAIKDYVEIAKKHKLDPAAMAIAFAANQPFVASVIIGATDMNQLKIAIDAGELKLSPAVMSDIAEVYRRWPDVTS